MRGGYLIIDLNNKNFENGVGMVVDGIYERIESTRKPVRFSNFVFGENEFRDIDLFTIGRLGSTYQADVFIGTTIMTVVISDEDIVTVTIKD